MNRVLAVVAVTTAILGASGANVGASTIAGVSGDEVAVGDGAVYWATWGKRSKSVYRADVATGARRLMYRAHRTEGIYPISYGAGRLTFAVADEAFSGFGNEPGRVMSIDVISGLATRLYTRPARNRTTNCASSTDFKGADAFGRGYLVEALMEGAPGTRCRRARLVIRYFKLEAGVAPVVLAQRTGRWRKVRPGEIDVWQIWTLQFPYWVWAHWIGFTDLDDNGPFNSFVRNVETGVEHPVRGVQIVDMSADGRAIADSDEGSELIPDVRHPETTVKIDVARGYDNVDLHLCGERLVRYSTPPARAVALGRSTDQWLRAPENVQLDLLGDNGSILQSRTLRHRANTELVACDENSVVFSGPFKTRDWRLQVLSRRDGQEFND